MIARRTLARYHIGRFGAGAAVLLLAISSAYTLASRADEPSAPVQPSSQAPAKPAPPNESATPPSPPAPPNGGAAPPPTAQTPPSPQPPATPAPPNESATPPSSPGSPNGGAAPPPQTPPNEGAAPAVPNAPSNATVLGKDEIQGILGKKVTSSAGEDMGQIVNVIVDRGGQPRAVVIDFGGFLGVGSRKIAVDWNALHFVPDGKTNEVTLALTRDQLKSAPEYKEGSPVVVIGSTGSTQTVPPGELP